MEIKILREVRQTNSTITNCHFRRTELGLFRNLLGSISGRMLWKVMGNLWELSDNPDKAQDKPFLHAGSQASMVKGQHGWTEKSSLPSSNTGKKYIKGISKSWLSLLCSAPVSVMSDALKFCKFLQALPCRQWASFPFLQREFFCGPYWT